MADNSNGAAIIEEELIHEIYASLLEGTSCRKCVALPLSARMTPASATSDAIVLASVSNNDPNVYGSNQEADVIPINSSYCSTPSSSQFMRFYRKSCRDVHQNCSVGKVYGGGKKKTGDQPCSIDNTSSSSSAQQKSGKSTGVENNRSHSVRTKEPHTATTKSERKRLIKREQELIGRRPRSK
jgi:hypothetical protein